MGLLYFEGLSKAHRPALKSFDKIYRGYNGGLGRIQNRFQSVGVANYDGFKLPLQLLGSRTTL